MKTNLKPEVIALLIPVLRELHTEKGSIRSLKTRVITDTIKDCYCIEGAIAECYRRQHPDICRWDGYSFVHQEEEGDFFTGSLPDAVYFWATDGDGRPAFIEGGFPVNLYAYNDDRGWKLNDFADALEKMNPDRDYDGA